MKRQASWVESIDEALRNVAQRNEGGARVLIRSGKGINVNHGTFICYTTAPDGTYRRFSCDEDWRDAGLSARARKYWLAVQAINTVLLPELALIIARSIFAPCDALLNHSKWKHAVPYTTPLSQIILWNFPMHFTLLTRGSTPLIIIFGGSQDSVMCRYTQNNGLNQLCIDKALLDWPIYHYLCYLSAKETSFHFNFGGPLK